MTLLLETAKRKEAYLDEASQRIEQEPQEVALDSAFRAFSQALLPDLIELDDLLSRLDAETREEVIDSHLDHQAAAERLLAVSDLQRRYLQLLVRFDEIRSMFAKQERFVLLETQRRIAELIACYRDILADEPSLYGENSVGSSIDDSSIRLAQKEFIPLERWLDDDDAT